MKEQSTTTGGPNDSTRSSSDPSVGDLFSGLARDTQELLRNEVALVKAEMSQSAKQMVSAVVKIAAGALILYAGFLMLLWAAVFGLREADLSWWASALIVGGAALFVGLILTLWAKSQLKSANLTPTETISSIKDDRAWVKGQMP